MPRRVGWIVVVLLGLALGIGACSQEQRAIVQTLVAMQAPPTETPYFSALVTPTPLPTLSGPLGTLTAIAPLIATPVEEAQPYVIELRGRPHFLEFHAWWCGACNAMRPSVRRLEARYQDQIDFHILNIDHLSSAALAAQYQVPGVPYIVLLDAQGQVVNRLLGYMTEEELIAAVEALLADHAARTG